MFLRSNMRSLKYIGSVRRQMFLTGLISLTTIALAANLLSKRHPGIDPASPSEIVRHSTIRKEEIYVFKPKEYSKREVRKTLSQNPVWSYHAPGYPVWSYHAPGDELFERANELVSSNLLILEDQTSNKDTKNFIGHSDSKLNPSSVLAKLSNSRGAGDQRASPEDYGLHLSPRKSGNLSGNLDGDATNLPPQQDFQKPIELLSDGGRWRSWPECLCAPQKDVDCSRLMEPAESRQLAHGSGGACSWRAWQDSGERVISVSLFGPRATHDYHLHNLVNASREHYEGWSVWVYLRHPVPSELCPLLQSAPHVFFCDTRVIPSLGDLKRTSPYIWRVSPLGDPRVKKLFVRNLNSSPIDREAAAVREWMTSNKTWHIMRDHPTQSDQVPGGQWGAQWQAGTETNMAALRHILLTRVVPSFTAEQANNFVSGALWSKILQGGSMQHDAYHCQTAPEDSFRPWPTRRSGSTFVGMSDAGGSMPDCPVECRPANHREWFTC